MARGATGYATWTSPDAPTKELDTATCVHCNNVFFINPRESASDAGGWCLNCNKPICKACAGNPECVPFLRKIERMEARDRLHRQICGDYR
jgi:hypothetical protein